MYVDEAARAERMEPDALRERIARYVTEREQMEVDAEERKFTMDELMRDLGFDVEKKATQMKIAEALEGLGLVQKREMKDGSRAWRWRKPGWLTLVPPAAGAQVPASCPTSARAKVGQEVGQDEDLSDVL